MANRVLRGVGGSVVIGDVDEDVVAAGRAGEIPGGRAIARVLSGHISPAMVAGPASRGVRCPATGRILGEACIAVVHGKRTRFVLVDRRGSERSARWVYAAIGDAGIAQPEVMTDVRESKLRRMIARPVLPSSPKGQARRLQSIRRG